MATRPALRLVRLFEEEKAAFIKQKEQEIMEKFGRNTAVFDELVEQDEASTEKLVSQVEEQFGMYSKFEQLLVLMATLKGL